MPIILPYKDKHPVIHPSAFIAENAVIIGDVTIGEAASVWYGCVLRGDVGDITVGARSNIQDLTLIHCTTDFKGTHVGTDVTIGHMAMLHACDVHDHGFVGMGAIILDGTVVESRAMVAAGALVTAHKTVKTGELWAGRPASLLRPLTDKDYTHMKWNSDHYVRLSRDYL
jgi:carbonic anhydrase/acetyltransferase-like protein (isoleucine patch superfamily)